MRLFLATPFYVLVWVFYLIGTVSKIFYNLSIIAMVLIGGGRIEKIEKGGNEL